MHAFLGATLAATSVGITARVLQDLGAAATQEARIILGAAVIDDVLGLVILGAVGGAIAAAAQETSVLVLSIAGPAPRRPVPGRRAGRRRTAAPRLFRSRRCSRPAACSSRWSQPAASCCVGLGLMGLAPIVGAFAAGLVLEDIHFKDSSGAAT